MSKKPAPHDTSDYQVDGNRRCACGVVVGVCLFSRFVPYRRVYGGSRRGQPTCKACMGGGKR